MSACLPSEAPISSATTFGTRSAMLLPHFRNSIRIYNPPSIMCLQCRYETDASQILSQIIFDTEMASSPFAYRQERPAAALCQHDRIDVPAVVGLAAMSH